MRWAEGHTYAVRRYFWRVVLSTRMTLAEKLEFLYFAPYYLQSLFFILGTALWIISEVYRRHPPFWTPALGWSLVVSNLFAIPLMGLAGVFLEGDLREDYQGVLSFIAVSYLVAPYQAYAALKGLLEKEEGTWIRTLKTGYITDGFIGLKFRSLVNWLRGLGLTNDGGGHPAWVEVPLPWAPVRMLLVAACVALMALPFVDRIPPLVEALTRLLLSDSVYAAAWRVLIG
jgi:hypothetical protein